MSQPDSSNTVDELLKTRGSVSRAMSRPASLSGGDADQHGSAAPLDVLIHEIRGALATLLVTLDVLDDGKAWEPGDAPRLLERARRSAAWIAALVDNPSWAATLREGIELHCAPFSIPEVIESCVRITEPLFTERGQQITVDFGNAAPLVYVDGTRIAQVLVNLLRNASTYGPRADVIEVRVSTQDQYVRVEVKDRGPGVPVDEQELIFRRHTRGSAGTTSQTKGEGLGLYLAKTLIEAHGGVIDVESVPGHGATFWFTLPRIEVEHRQTAKAQGGQAA